MTILEKVGLPFLQKLDPERAHGLALLALRAGLGPKPGPVTSPRLRTSIAGISLANPLGLAAGFDKNAVALRSLSEAGFGFLEVGAATPHPQEGNPPPRLFRLATDRGAINRFGFNNDGINEIAARLASRPATVPIGLNLGANKNSADRAADFAEVLSRAGASVDFATVNVSSPNTEKLRDLQGADALKGLLDGVLAARRALPRPVPVFLKIAPDLSDNEIAAIAATATDRGIDGIIATNTTLARDGLRSAARGEKGGLSGAPLLERSTRVLAEVYRATEGRLPLIGVGGVQRAEDIVTKVRAGASAVQLYTALAYDGLSLASRMLRDLDRLLEREGIENIADLRGVSA
ncbi:MAG: quinone-dependent dihydroorotate dehydrogenase [Pseudomonadota bacterium]